MLVSEECLLASAFVVVLNVRNRKHCKARHSTAPYAGHDTARHRTVLPLAVDLAKLNGAGYTAVFFCAFRYTYAAGCDTKKELEPAPINSESG